MNEQIKLLALQAWQSVNDQVRNQKALMPNIEISQDDITDIFEEKFAELIVRECIEISQVGSITESKLKQHFGVER